MVEIRAFEHSVLVVAAVAIAFGGPAQSKEPEIHIVWMGGSDCPPCMAWRKSELPKLEKSSAFNAIKFSYVVKPVRSSVPPSFLLPTDVKQYKEKLDFASAGRIGSPQTAILVNGEVFDYFHSTRTAEEFQQMILAIQSGGKYPFERCLKASSTWRKCEVVG